MLPSHPRADFLFACDRSEGWSAGSKACARRGREGGNVQRQRGDRERDSKIISRQRPARRIPCWPSHRRPATFLQRTGTPQVFYLSHLRLYAISFPPLLIHPLTIHARKQSALDIYINQNKSMQLHLFYCNVITYMLYCKTHSQYRLRIKSQLITDIKYYPRNGLTKTVNQLQTIFSHQETKK